MNISVVIPLLNEEESLPELTSWIEKVMNTHTYSYEILLIDDGSTDNSWDVIEDLAKKNTSIKAIRLQRNYGKSAALFCGFKKAQGDVVITMDADLQDSPDEIPELYRMITEQNFDLVSGWKKKRYDNVVAKNFPSKIFNATARKVSKIKLHDFNCGLKAYKKKVIKTVEVYGEMHRYIPVLAAKAGFKRIGEKIVRHQKRKYGITKFGWERFINGFLDLLSITFISKFGKRPMHFFGLWGTVMFIFGFFASTYLGAYKLYCVYNNLSAARVTDNPSFYIALTSMIIGSQLFLAGFLGELISRSASDRNNYMIDNEI